MKVLLFILFPFCLQAQIYQLDSVRNSNDYGWNISKYSYQDESNFKIRYEEYGPNGLRQTQDTYIEDSLLVYQLRFNLSDSLKIYYEYDELRRGIKWTSYKNDTLRQEIKYSYHANTNLPASESGIVYKNGDTASYRDETPRLPLSCKIVRDLDENAFYFDLGGRPVQYGSASQYLIEINDRTVSKVLFIHD